MKLHIDIETYSSVDIRSRGSYKYMESLDFEILLAAYAFDNGPVYVIDLAQGDKLPDDFTQTLVDPGVLKYAHNANFERNAFKAYGYDTPIKDWRCSQVKAAYCGLPLGLEDISVVMDLGDKAKLATGRALIKYFCSPCKPTKSNGHRERNFPEHDLSKWEEFKRYCAQDVEAEREIDNRLLIYPLPSFERVNYILDQEINDRGILVDLPFAKNAYNIDSKNSKALLQRIKALTGVDNPNSAAQLKTWLGNCLQREVKSLAKGEIAELVEEAGPGVVSEVLGLRVKSAKSSIKKYTTMLNCACEDSRARGLFQFYGASRTGRWAGRLIQLQNLPQNHLEDLEAARDVVAAGDGDLLDILYDDASSVLSQLIRTAFVAKEGYSFIVADFSSIEARVIAWLAGETWRMDVFNSHGKIYEASASTMFNVPIESVTKGSDLRAKAKVAELALGYQGALGALKQMGGESMGLTESEMSSIVKRWRAANPAIVQLWKSIENLAKRAMKTRKRAVSKQKGLIFEYNGAVLTIELPSGRKLFYQEPSFTINQFKQQSIQYKETKQWGNVDTYGGKLTENITQAIARDLLADAMLRIDAADIPIVMHVHDEAVCEVPELASKPGLALICNIMSEPVSWAKGLPLAADGHITKFYKKD